MEREGLDALLVFGEHEDAGPAVAWPTDWSWSAAPRPSGPGCLRRTDNESAPAGPGKVTAHSTTIRTAAVQRWRMVANYAKVTISAWGTNAEGLTYGVVNAHGTPDLVAVTATNGRSGYVYAKDLAEPTPANPSQALQPQHSRAIIIHLPVYQADGKPRSDSSTSNARPGSSRPQPRTEFCRGRLVAEGGPPRPARTVPGTIGVDGPTPIQLTRAAVCSPSRRRLGARRSVSAASGSANTSGSAPSG